MAPAATGAPATTGWSRCRFPRAEAIYYADDVPDEWADYVRANVEFFEALGSPQGASALGNLRRDHPVVAGMPATAGALG